jgi:hypothetical protein
MAKFAILIPTVVTREAEFKRLVDILEPQVKKHKGEVEVLVYWNNFEQELGEIRQRMLENATAEYVAFIDDDDTVSDDYCDLIVPLLDGVDHIGFKLKFTENGRQHKPVYHSKEKSGGRYYDDSTGFYRPCSAKDPIKRSIALQGHYEDGDYRKNIGEEDVWIPRVTPLIHTEHFIDKEIYHYDKWHGKGVFGRYDPAEGNYTKPKLPKYFKHMEWK